MSPWLPMLSQRPARRLHQGGCHRGGYWISRRNALSQEELEAFVQFAGSYDWPGRSSEALAHLCFEV